MHLSSTTYDTWFLFFSFLIFVFFCCLIRVFYVNLMRFWLACHQIQFNSTSNQRTLTPMHVNGLSLDAFYQNVHFLLNSKPHFPQFLENNEIAMHFMWIWVSDACLFIALNFITFTLTLNAMILRRWHLFAMTGVLYAQTIFQCIHCAVGLAVQWKSNIKSQQKNWLPTQNRVQYNYTNAKASLSHTLCAPNELLFDTIQHLFIRAALFLFLSLWCCHFFTWSLWIICVRCTRAFKIEGKFRAHK